MLIVCGQARRLHPLHVWLQLRALPLRAAVRACVLSQARRLSLEQRRPRRGPGRRPFPPSPPPLSLHNHNEPEAVTCETCRRQCVSCELRLPEAPPLGAGFSPRRHLPFTGDTTGHTFSHLIDPIKCCIISRATSLTTVYP